MNIDAEWVEHHFDHLSHDLAPQLYDALSIMRSKCPVVHSDQHGGFWVASKYEDILRIAQDWESFSSELGITVPHRDNPVKSIPVNIDPPLHREYKRLINAYFTPTAVAPWEPATRRLVTRLIDGFVETGQCDFMEAFARPFPGLAFLDFALHAPADRLSELAHYAELVSSIEHPDSRDALAKLMAWVREFLDQRRQQPPQGDVVDAVLNATIEGRPITPDECAGIVQLLIFGGLDTTAGVLGMAMLRFCAHPEIPHRLGERPELIPDAVEELLRLDGSFVCIGRTARRDAEVSGHTIKAGERIIMYWASANRDEDEFENADTFDLERAQNRHVAFGAGPHRCAGSNLARMNLRIAIEEIVRRMHGIELQPGAEIGYHSTFNRMPLSVPITFTPGPQTA